MSDNLKKLASAQQQLVAKIYSHPDKIAEQPVVKPSEFLTEFKKRSVDDCRQVFGDYGSMFRSIVEQMDESHPDFAAFVANITNSSDKELLELMQLFDLAKGASLGTVCKSFVKCFVKSVMFDVKTKVDLLKRKTFIRLFKQADRVALRKVKDSRPVELELTPPRRIQNSWDSITEIDTYSRFSDYWKKQAEVIDHRSKVYSQLGFRNFTEEMQKTLDDLTEAQAENYYGFQRVSVSSVTVALAKLHGYKLDETQRITVPASLIPKDGKLGNQSDNNLLYMPTMYPLCQVKESKKMEPVINHLEAFPEANNCAIFDSFLLVVPGVANLSKPIVVDGKIKEFNDPWKAKVYVDDALIETQAVYPALLAEKDGKMFFISLWEV